MVDRNGIFNIDGATWSTSLEITIQYITFVFSANSGVIVLQDRNGVEVFRCANGTSNQLTYHHYLGSKTVDGLDVLTWTNATRVSVGLV